MNNTTQFQNTKNTDKSKKWFIILIVILAVIIIVATILVLTIKKEIPAINQNQNVPLETANVNLEPQKLVRYGKMILQTDKDSVLVDETFKVDILMDTQNSNIVVAQGNVIYDEQVLELVKIDEENSVLSMAVIKNQEPGQVEIIRGMPGDSDYLDADDGYTGSDGILASLEFKTLKSGPANISFEPEKSKLILDDGRGTPMVTEYKNMSVNVQ